jgi:hypothetical protein
LFYKFLLHCIFNEIQAIESWQQLVENKDGLDLDKCHVEKNIFENLIGKEAFSFVAQDAIKKVNEFFKKKAIIKKLN